MSSAETQKPSVLPEVLKQSLAAGHLPHALLFFGPEGSGQKEAVIALAKALFCQSPTSGESCGICQDCRLAEQNTHPDLITLSPEEGSLEIKIAAIRELITKAAFKPFQARAKVFFIDPADAMNEQAQNALLKTLEEPQGQTYLVLSSYANEKILPTVRSRVQRILFRPRESQGQRDPEVENMRKRVFDYLCGEGAERTAPDLVALEREQIVQVFERLVCGFRDLLLMKAGADEALGIIEDRPMKERLLKGFSTDELLDIIDGISGYKEKAVQSTNLKLLLSVFWSEFEGLRKKHR